MIFSLNSNLCGVVLLMEQKVVGRKKSTLLKSIVKISKCYRVASANTSVPKIAAEICNRILFSDINPTWLRVL
jgi:hypothetical protein